MSDDQSIESIKNQLASLKSSVDSLIDFHKVSNDWHSAIEPSVGRERLLDIQGTINSIVSQTNALNKALILISTNLNDLSQKLS